jgi:tetratricopeptide (TPR) repeat protein/transglutaminase-like putative cysteine protease
MCSIRCWSVLLLAASALPFVQAQSTPAQKQVLPDFSKEAFVVERLYTRVQAENDGTGTREVTAEVRVLADAGVKAFAVLNFTYTSDNEVVEIDYVRVRKPDGTVVKTPDYNIQDMPGEVTRTAPLYSDIHEKHVAVKGLGVGDVLEYLVRVRVTKPQVSGQFWFEYSFTKDSVSKDDRLELSLPGGKYFKIVSPEFKPDVAEESGRRIYRWAHSNLIVKVKDGNEVPRRIPPNPDVQVTTFASWEDVGKWYGALQKEPLQVTAAIQAKAAELTKGLKSDDEKIRAIYIFVSLKFHYIGLDFGIGRYQPHAAEDVLDNGYGDCKDKHTLLAALLKAAGYDAWPVLIHTRRKLDAEVPSPAQFNHVISLVPTGGSYIWLDTTPEVAPYRLLLQPLRNKQALVIPSEQMPKLITTPENPPEPQRQEFSMSGKLDAHGTFSGHAELTYAGDTEVGLRAAFRNVPESQWKEFAQRFSRALNFAGDVSEVKVTPPDEFDKPFRITYDYVRKDFGDWENHHIIAPLPPMGVESSKYVKETKPSEPVVLGALGTVTYRSRVELPEGYKLVPPPPVHLVEPYAEYDAATNVEDEVMTTTRNLKVKKTEVPLSEWEEYRKFGRAIGDDEFNFMTLEENGKSVSANKSAEPDADKENGEAKVDAGADLDRTFRDGTTALQRHDFQQAQDLFEKILATNPEYKGAHFNLGLALAAQKDLSRSMEQFREEEKVSPQDPRAYQVVASYSMQIGKTEEAIQEWRKLVKVDPKNRTAASTLAGLLYEGEKYQDAADVLEPAVQTAPDSASLLRQLGDVYVKLGQNEKALANYREVLAQKGDDPELLNEIAYNLAENKISLDLARQYAEKALQKLEEQGQGAESSDEAGLRVTFDLAMLWDTLGWVYFQQGDMNRAEPFVRAAWLLGEDELVAEHLGEIYAKEGKAQQAAHCYELALAVSSAPKSMPGFPQTNVIKAARKQEDAISARYQKLTGKKPAIEIRRLPNGQWTETPAEQLRHSREIELRNERKLSGKAQFLVRMKPDKVDSADYASGDETLKPLVDSLKAAHYPLIFPPESAAILVLRVDVSCQAGAPCKATPLPAVVVSPGNTLRAN